MIDMTDVSTPEDKRKKIDFLDFMVYGGEWYLHAMCLEHAGAHTVRYAMFERQTGSKSPQFTVWKGNPPIPWQPVPTIRGIPTLPHLTHEDTKYLQVKIVGPGLTVGEFTKFITDRKMEEYDYIDGRGRRFWLINVLAELEKAGYVPAGSTKQFLDYNREKHLEYKEAKEKKIWPANDHGEEIAVGRFQEYKPIWMPSKKFD